MNKKYSDNQIHDILKRFDNGESVASIVASSSIPRSTVYAWIKSSKEKNSKQEVSLRNYRTLEAKVKRLEGIIEILQKADCRISDPLKDRLNALEKLYEQYSVYMLCEALKVPRGTFYNHILRNKRDNTWYSKQRELHRVRIQEIYDEHNQIFGAAKIAAIMKSEGYRISADTVRELMRDMGLTSIRQDSKEIYDKEKRRHKNYLNQQFTTTRPNEVWVSDVTCFRLNDKNYFICAILDLYARRVVGYRIGKNNSTQLVKSTFKMAYEERKPTMPLMFHTDRGTNYRAVTFCSYLKSLGVIQSFSRAHVPYDNSVMESFFSSLKREELYRTKYRSDGDFRAAVDRYMTFYNEVRPHVKNAYKTPLVKEQEYYSKQGIFEED